MTKRQIYTLEFRTGKHIIDISKIVAISVFDSETNEDTYSLIIKLLGSHEIKVNGPKENIELVFNELQSKMDEDFTLSEINNILLS